MPARSIFDSRNWPEGYNFPACDRCNRFTRLDEVVIAMLSRMRNRDDLTTELQGLEMRRALAGVRNNFPDAYEAMRLRPNEVRRFLKNMGRQRPIGLPLSDVPVVSIGQPGFLNAIRTFATKLFCALHYKHTGQIVPSTGVISGRFFSNVQVIDGKIPEDILSIVGGKPDLIRSNNDLHNQFSYQFAIASEQTTSVFLCAFRESFAMIGMCCVVDDVPDVFNDDMKHGKFRSKPFNHG